MRLSYFGVFAFFCIIFSVLAAGNAHATSYKDKKPQLKVQEVHEPEFKPVKFYKLTPPKTLRERVERLTHGMLMDLPPEYDYYGYEIRRFMARVGNPAVLDSPRNIEGQLQNIQVAQKVAAEWQAASLKEVKEIEALIEETNASSSVRSLYQTQKAEVQAFFLELNSWIKNNRDSLSYLLEIGPNRYQYQGGEFRFSGGEEFKKYLALHESRLRALEQMHDYMPFRVMVY